MPVTKRDTEILRLIGDHGLVDALGIYSRLFGGRTAKACERRVTRLLQLGLICSYPLIGARRYYTLSQRGAKLIGLSDRRAGDCFAAQGLLTNYAIMSFCMHGETHYSRMTREEFAAKFPLLLDSRVVSRSHRTRYYLDHSGATETEGIVRLSLFVCDFGSRLRRIQRKVRREIQKRYEAGPAWKAMVEARLFSITVLTFHQAKASRLQKLLVNEPFSVRVCFVAGIGELLSSGGQS